jgi:hypothetical protein
MDKISHALAWAVSHSAQIIEFVAAVAAGLLSLVGTIKNVVTRYEQDTGRMYPKADSRLHMLQDLFAWVAKYGHKGVAGPFSVPGFPSVPENGPGFLPAWLPIAFLALACGACPLAKKVAYDAKACAIGEAPKAIDDTVQQAVGSLTGAPGTPSWSDFAKGALVARGIDAAICIVLAAVHDIDQAMSGTKGQPDPGYIGGHQLAVDWLEQHGVHHDHDASMKAMHAQLPRDFGRLRLTAQVARFAGPKVPCAPCHATGQLEPAMPQICDSTLSDGSTICRTLAFDNDDVSLITIGESSRSFGAIWTMDVDGRWWVRGTEWPDRVAVQVF